MCGKNSAILGWMVRHFTILMPAIYLGFLLTLFLLSLYQCALIKQFHHSVTKSDYITLRQGFVMVSFLM